MTQLPDVSTSHNRFQDFFVEHKYLLLKNYLYNYRLRKKAIESALPPLLPDLPPFLLEIGSGISPVVTEYPHVVYSDLSFSAMQVLRHTIPNARCVVANGTQLPFKDESFGYAASSEVLEHVPDDQAAIDELARVMYPGGNLLITVPHQEWYYAYDDKYVHHYRRYTVATMKKQLNQAGFTTRTVKKVLGPLDKLVMCSFVGGFELIQRLFTIQSESAMQRLPNLVVHLFKWLNDLFALIARVEVAIIPRSLATVILFKAQKEK